MSLYSSHEICKLPPKSSKTEKVLKDPFQMHLMFNIRYVWTPKSMREWVKKYLTTLDGRLTLGKKSKVNLYVGLQNC